MIDAWEQPDAPEPLGMPLQPMLMAKLMQAVDDHHVEEFMNVAAGQGVGLIDEIRPTSQVIADMVAEARAILAGEPLPA